MVLVLKDDDVEKYGDMHLAIGAVERALKAQADGKLVALPRHYVDFSPGGRLVFTIGGAVGERGAVGFRAYDTFGARDAEHKQIVAVWDPDTAELRGIVLGERLGELRTGAIGGIAI